jgi:hypothetical protein
MSTTIPDVPVPAGFRADGWQDDALPNRCLFGDLRTVDGLDVDCVSVQASAVQLADGRVDDGGLYEPPQVHLCDDALSTAQARQLAAVLIEAAGNRPAELGLMTITDPTVDDLAQLCAAMARDEACEIMQEIKPRDLTACEIVALLTVLRPARERKRVAERQPAPVLELRVRIPAAWGTPPPLLGL